MADNSLNAIAAALRAMEQVVTPAVDPDHPLAREQAELVTGTLRLLLEQLPHARGRQVYELEHNVRLAEDVVHLADADLGAELTEAVVGARRLLDDVGPTGEELRAATARVTAGVSALVRAAAETPGSATSSEVCRRVLQGSAPLITGQRAWLAGQGWGTDGVPGMDQLFGAATSEHRGTSKENAS